MLKPQSPESIDYLAIGHITQDILPDGYRLGGSVTYAALTAQALGLRAGILSSWGEGKQEDMLHNIQILNVEDSRTTTFQNIETNDGRKQIVTDFAGMIDFDDVPIEWQNTSIVHLGPVVHELNPLIIDHFSSSLLAVTPQGWFRNWDNQGQISYGGWPEAVEVLGRVGAAVISVEDIGGDELLIEELAQACPVLAVTEGERGARLYWNGDVRRYKPPPVQVIDTTGAGDIFAAAFFTRIYMTRDPWEATRFATQLAANSVTRAGLEGIPTQKEIQESLVEIY